jgi:hypothetical protein
MGNKVDSGSDHHGADTAMEVTASRGIKVFWEGSQRVHGQADLPYPAGSSKCPRKGEIWVGG